MDFQSTNTENIVVENCILSFPKLFKAEQINGKGDPVFTAALLLDQNGVNQVWTLLQQFAQTAFPNGEYNQPNFHWPFSPANQNKNYANNPRLASLHVMNAKSNEGYPPQVVDEARQVVVDRGKIYAGCIVAAAVRFYSYTNMGKSGIGCGLIAIMKQGDGESLGGDTPDANALFAGVQAQTPAVTPMQGMPDMGQPAPMQQPQMSPNGMPAPTAPVAQAPADNSMPTAPFGTPGMPGQ